MFEFITNPPITFPSLSKPRMIKNLLRVASPALGVIPLNKPRESQLGDEYRIAKHHIKRRNTIPLFFDMMHFYYIKSTNGGSNSLMITISLLSSLSERSIHKAHTLGV